MKLYMIGKSMRFFFLLAASIILAGIWLTGFSVVHWLLYIPTLFFYFAAFTGICPGIIISRLIFQVKPETGS